MVPRMALGTSVGVAAGWRSMPVTCNKPAFLPSNKLGSATKLVKCALYWFQAPINEFQQKKYRFCMTNLYWQYTPPRWQCMSPACKQMQTRVVSACMLLIELPNRQSFSDAGFKTTISLTFTTISLFQSLASFIQENQLWKWWTIWRDIVIPVSDQARAWPNSWRVGGYGKIWTPGSLLAGGYLWVRFAVYRDHYFFERASAGKSGVNSAFYKCHIHSQVFSAKFCVSAVTMLNITGCLLHDTFPFVSWMGSSLPY